MVIAWHDISYDTSTNTATFGECSIKPGWRCKKLLVFMIENAGKLCTYKEIGMGVWGKIMDNCTIQALVAYLVAKVAPSYDLSQRLTQVSCCGYMLIWPDELPKPDIVHGPISVYSSVRKVAVDGQAIHLRPKEYDFLVHMLELKLPFYAYEFLSNSVYGHDFVQPKTIIVQVGSLNRKLRACLGRDVIIHRNGLGFLLS